VLLGEIAAVYYENQRKHIKIFCMSKQVIQARFLWNVRNHCPIDTASLPRRLESSDDIYEVITVL